jgi:hypothetical protein
MASHRLIDDHLAALARRLPADAVDELADGLIETWRHHIATGLDPADAARAAVTDFGTPEQITDAFVAQAPGRRTALLLLGTGPVVGACWGAGLVATHAWTWPVPTAAAALVALALLAVVAVLAAAGTSRHSYRRTRLAAVGGCCLLALDATMLAAALLLAPTVVPPMAVAMGASLARIGLTVRLLPGSFAR